MVISSLKWGALIGLTSYLMVDVALTAIGLFAFGSGSADPTANPGKLTLGCAGLFLLLFAFSAAGFFAGRETGRSGAGALAGLVAGAIYAALIQVYTPGGSSFGASAGASGPAAGVAATIIVLAITVLLYLGVAALMGWLGGRPGAQRSPLRKRTLAAAPGAGETPR
jgi:hypothetical protein